MSSVIEKLEREQLQRLPEIKSGDRVRVHVQVVEGNRRRTQVFEGVVIARSGHGVRETITVRKQSFGVGVERVFPLHSPKIEQIEVAGRGDVRRAKLYYLRDRIGRRARVRERTDLAPEEAIQRELLEGPSQPEDGAMPDQVDAEAGDAAADDHSEAAAEGDAEAVAAEGDASAEPAAESEAEADSGPAADAGEDDTSGPDEAGDEPEAAEGGDAAGAAESADGEPQPE